MYVYYIIIMEQYHYCVINAKLTCSPAVLFLDEPTSGLDTTTSLSIVATLVELAHVYNHTVICTVHQPRSQIFHLFDYLMILAVRLLACFLFHSDV